MSTEWISKRYSIMAPHVDDEVIGCYRLLSEGLVETVNYFYELSEERVNEAKACARHFGFRANFFKDTVTEDEVRMLTDGNIVVVPHINDQHPHHKLVNKFAHRVWKDELSFYSVDMNVKVDLLNADMRREKQQILYNLFPTQQPLFNQDSKYFLFEALLVTDWTEMQVRDPTSHQVYSYWVKPT